MRNERRFGLTGIGHALGDLLVFVDEEALDHAGVVKSSSGLVEAKRQREILEICESSESELRCVSGGSVSNSIVTFAQLGGSAALLGCVGRDIFGQHFLDDLKLWGVTFPLSPTELHSTGTSLVMVTSDGERTMSTCLAAGGEISPAQVDQEVVASSDWVLVEGYLLANPNFSGRGVFELCKMAKQSGAQVALTCSDPWVVDGHRSDLREILPYLDLLVANHQEAYSLVKGMIPGRDVSDSQYEEVFRELMKLVPETAMTWGEKGALVSSKLEEISVDCLRVETNVVSPVDLTGAGDAFLGGYLFARTQGESPVQAARKGHELAGKVISKVGARLSTTDL